MIDKLTAAKTYFKNKNIFLCTYGHGDYSWIHTRDWHIHRYVTMLEEAADDLDAIPDFKYYIDSYAAVLEPVIKRHPEILARLKKYAAEGRFAVCGTYSNIRPNMTEGEAFIRNICIGNRLFQEAFGDIEIKVYADTVDVVASHGQLPQLLKKGGFDFIRIGRPRDILKQKGIALDHVRVGIDGSEVICSYASTAGFWNRENVGEIFCDDIEKSIANLYEIEFSEDGSSFTSNNIMKGSGCDDGIPFYCYHPDKKLPIPEFLEKWRNEGINIKFATPIEYFEALSGDYDSLQKVVGPIDVCEVSFNACLGGEKSLQNDRLLSSREILSAELSSAVNTAVLETEPFNSENLWKENLFCSAHASSWAYKADYKDLKKRIGNTISCADSVITSCCQDIADAIPYSDQNVAVVFNLHDKPVTKYVTLSIATPDPEKLKLTDGFGNSLEFQAIHPYYFSFMGDMVWEWDYVVKLDIPAVGYNTIIVEKGAIDTKTYIDWVEPEYPSSFDVDTELTLASDRLQLTFQKGKIIKILKDGENQLCGQNGYNAVKFYQYNNDPGKFDFPTYPIQKVYDVIWEKGEILSNGPIVWSVKLYGKVFNHKITQVITFYQGDTRISIDIEADYAKEYGLLTLSMPCTVESLYGGIPFGTEKKQVNQEIYLDNGTVRGWDEVGCQHRFIDGLFYAQDFIGQTANGVHMAQVTLSGDRYYLYDRNTNEVGHVLMQTALLLPKWTADLNETSFACFGAHTFSHRLILEDAGIREDEMYAKAQEVRTPDRIIRQQDSSKDRGLPLAKSFLSSEKDNIRISAFYQEGGAYILRLWESKGEDIRAEINLPFEPKSAVVTDFIGNTDSKKQISIHRNTIKLQCGRHEIVTVKLT